MEWLTDLNELEEDVPHRPGKLYQFNKEKFGAAIPKVAEVKKSLAKAAKD